MITIEWDTIKTVLLWIVSMWVGLGALGCIGYIIMTFDTRWDNIDRDGIYQFKVMHLVELLICFVLGPISFVLIIQDLFHFDMGNIFEMNLIKFQIKKKE